MAYLAEQNNELPGVTDSPVGVAIMLLAFIGEVVSLSFYSAISTMFVALAGPQQPQMTFSPNPGGGAPLLVASNSNAGLPQFLAFVVPLVVFVLMFVCGAGIYTGNRGAFGLGIVVFAFVTLGGGGASVLGGGVVLYCVLRLLGVIRGEAFAVPAVEHGE